MQDLLHELFHVLPEEIDMKILFLMIISCISPPIQHNDAVCRVRQQCVSDVLLRGPRVQREVIGRVILPIPPATQHDVIQSIIMKSINIGLDIKKNVVDYIKHPCVSDAPRRFQTACPHKTAVWPCEQMLLRWSIISNVMHQ